MCSIKTEWLIDLPEAIKVKIATIEKGVGLNEYFDLKQNVFIKMNILIKTNYKISL